MMKKSNVKKIVAGLVIIFGWSGAVSAANFNTYFEAGPAFSAYSDISIPRDSANEFSFVDNFSPDPVLSYRLETSWRFKENYGITAVVAPLTVTGSGAFDRDIDFAGETFSAGEDIDEARYRFDSYRLRFRYYFMNDSFFKGLGLTAKIRDAEISLESDLKKATKTNTGFVPIINFLMEWDLAPDWYLTVDGDALFSKFGRAEDILVSLKYDLSDKSSVNLGYRFLEGGSDVEEVYSFSLFNYAVAGITVNY
ncbi:MAG: hypothetical protein ACQEQC_06245 [Elusimicrobiota bacterium]